MLEEGALAGGRPAVVARADGHAIEGGGAAGWRDVPAASVLRTGSCEAGEEGAAGAGALFFCSIPKVEQAESYFARGFPCTSLSV